MRFLIGRGKSAAAKSAAPRRARRRLDLRGWRGKAAAGALVAVALGGSALLLQHGFRKQGWAAQLENEVIALSATAGLAVDDVEVEGRVMTAKSAILRAVGAQRGTPLFAINPSEAKAQLETLPWIRSAAVERRLPGTIYIRIAERTPFAFWQRQGKLYLIDRDGTVITDEALNRFPGLIVIVGEDAPRHAAELLDMVASEPEIARHVTAAVRVGGRRWNVHLDNGVDVELPEENAAAAWKQLAELDRTSRVLARNIEIVDMRLPDRLVLRVVPDPAKEHPKKGRQSAKST